MATNKRRDASFLIGRMTPDARLQAVKAADSLYSGLPILGRMAVKPDTYKERHAHSTAWAASIVDGKLSYRKLQNPGQTTVKPVTPSWYNTVRTDTTDKLQRNRISVKASKSSY